MLWFFLYLAVCIVFYYILYQLSDYDLPGQAPRMKIRIRMVPYKPSWQWTIWSTVIYLLTYQNSF